MKRLFALAAALLVVPAGTAYANSHCNYGGGLTVTNGLGIIPPGTYSVVPRPSDGVDSIFVPSGPTGFYLPVTQLTILGIPFSVSHGGNPFQMTCGAPSGSTYMAVADALDMDFDFDVDGDSDTIGGAATVWDVANEDGQRFDLKYAKGIQLSEGSRTRLVLTVPVRYLRVTGEDGGIAGSHGDLSALSAGLGVGLSVPVKPDWWLTPRMSYTMVQASRNLGSDSELMTASVASNYRFSGMGRGELTMGNMVAYTQTIRTGITSQDSDNYVKQRNWWFRNGLAYQMPLKNRMFGRQTSLRGSYVFTLGTKDTMAFEQTHEVAINFGFRMRETEQRSGSDLLRVGLLFTHAKNEYFKNADYDSLTLTVGYRF